MAHVYKGQLIYRVQQNILQTLAALHALTDSQI